MLFPEHVTSSGFGVIRVVFRYVIRGSFALVSLVPT